MTRGFTLIEVLIYTGIIGMMAVFFVLTAYQILDAANKNQTQIIEEEEANFLLRKIGWVLSGTQTITAPPVGATSSILSVNKYNFPQNPLVIDLNSQNVRLAYGGGGPNALSSQSVKIDSLIFEYMASTTKVPEAVKINLTVNTKSFETTIYLRK